MSYAPYPAYKDSGIPWLGQVPEGWEPKKIKYVVNYIGSGKTPRGGAEIYTDDGIMILRSQNVYDDGLRLKDVAYVTPEVEALQINTRVQPADVLLNITGASIGRSSIVPGDLPTANVNQHVCIFRPQKTKIDPKFLHAFFCSSIGKEQVTSNENGTSREGLNFQQAGNLHLVLPPLEQQNAIADFLDKKTAEIDDLIAKKEELLRLLAEQRTALITHAVTKGLNPNAPMKPSGIDWLGDVPEGWEVKPFKREVWYQEGPGIMAVDFRDDGVPLLRIRNLKPGKVELEGCNFLDHDMANGKWAHFQVEKGDRLISTSASTGLVSVVDADAVGAIPYTGIIRIRPLSDSLLPEFLEYFVSSELFFDQIELLATGTTIQHFGPYHLNQMVMAVPPIEEQCQLIETLASALSKISETKGMVEIALGRLREYRTALITNAVTGKIKVV